MFVSLGLTSTSAWRVILHPPCKQFSELHDLLKCLIHQLEEMQESTFLPKLYFNLGSRSLKNLGFSMLFLTLLHLINNDSGRKRKYLFSLIEVIEYCLIRLTALL